MSEKFVPPATLTIVYVGRDDEVDIWPNGDEERVQVEKGKPIELPYETAYALLTTTSEMWEEHRPKKSAKEAGNGS